MGSSGAVSLKPIMTSPTSAPRPSTMAFVASVVERAAILIRAGSIACAAAPNPEAGSCPSSPTFSNKLPRHESIARVRSCLVVKILLLARISFRSRSKRTPSVKVPPVSMPRARLVIYAASSFTTCFCNYYWFIQRNLHFQYIAGGQIRSSRTLLCQTCRLQF